MLNLVARAAVAACARASKRRRVEGGSAGLSHQLLSFPPSQQHHPPPPRPLNRSATTTTTEQQQQQRHHPHQRLLRVVDLTTMRAAAASLRAFGGGGDDDVASAVAAALAAASAPSFLNHPLHHHQQRVDVRELAGDPSDPPLLIPYAAASALQDALAEQLRLATPAAPAAQPKAASAATHTPPPHTLLLLQHAPVFTVGKRGRGHGFPTDAHMRRALAAGAQLDADSPRGGQATFHGPGQAVAYPVVCVRGLGLGARRYVEALEDAAARAVGAWGVRAEGRQPAGRTGVWAGGRKIAAVGVRVSRGVATHGLALNVADGCLLGWFRLIDPCGLLGEEAGEGKGVLSGGYGEEEVGEDGDDGVTTSLWRELGKGGDGAGRAAAAAPPPACPPPWPTVRGVAGGVAHALARALALRAVWPTGQEEEEQEGRAAPPPRMPPLPPEAARAVLDGVACTARALALRPPSPRGDR